MTPGLDRLELLECHRYVLLLLFQKRPSLMDLLQEVLKLPHLAGFGIVEVDDSGDLGQRKPKTLTAQDQFETSPVAVRIDPGLAPPLRCQQALILIEPDCPRGNVEFL